MVIPVIYIYKHIKKGHTLALLLLQSRSDLVNLKLYKLDYIYIYISTPIRWYILFLIIILSPACALVERGVGVLECEEPVEGGEKGSKGRNSRWSIIRSVISVPSPHSVTVNSTSTFHTVTTAIQIFKENIKLHWMHHWKKRKTYWNIGKTVCRRWT